MNTVVELEVVVHMFIQDGTSGKYKSKLEPTSLHNLLRHFAYFSIPNNLFSIQRTGIVATFVISFIIWWYYRYRYRRAHQVVVAQVRPPQAVHTTVTESVMRVPAAYPVYPPPGQATFIPGTGNTQYTAYPPQVYAYQDPPPPYTSAPMVKQGAFVSTSS